MENTWSDKKYAWLPPRFKARHSQYAFVDSLGETDNKPSHVNDGTSNAKWKDTKRQVNKEELQVSKEESHENKEELQVNKEESQVSKEESQVSKESVDPLEEVHRLLSQKEYKRACQLSIQRRLFSQHLRITEMVVPLLLEDEYDLVEKYLKEDKTLQRETVKFLDSIVFHNLQHVAHLCRHHPNPRRAKGTRLRGKALKRLMDTYCDKFELRQERALTINLQRRERNNALSFYVNLKHANNTRRCNWRSLIDMIVGPDPVQGYRLVDYLIGGRHSDEDFEEAVYWVYRLNLEEQRLPPGFVYDMHQLSQEIFTSIMEDADEMQSWSSVVAELEASGHVYLKLPKSSVIMVDTVGTYHDMIDHLWNTTEAGIDAENCPHDHINLETLQIATADRIFIVDVPALLGFLSDSDWERMVWEFFGNEECLKLGYSVVSDIAKLAQNVKCLSSLESKCKNLIDLEPLEKKVFAASTRLLERRDDSIAKGLAGLVENILSLKLDKRDQMSNWSKRPLTDQQLHYAALDAFVLIDIYKQMSSKASEVDAELFSSIVKQLSSNGNRLNTLGQIYSTGKNKTKVEKDKEKMERVQMKEQMLNPKENQVNPMRPDPIKPHQLKVVCDAHLAGLCKKLRTQGIDSIVIEQFEPFEMCGTLAQRDSRAILTRGYHYIRLRQFVNAGQCLNINSDIVDEQVQQVLAYFNVAVGDEDIFSRCTLCNSVKYITITREQANIIHDAIVKAKQGSNRNVCPVGDDEDEDDDDYFDDYDDDQYENEKEGSGFMKCGGDEVYLNTGMLKSTGVELKFGDLAERVLRVQDEFYACTNCGHVYWQGSHWVNARKSNQQ